MRGHPTSTSEYHDDTQDELLTKFDPEPGDQKASGLQRAVAAALASVRAEGLEPGTEDLALFAKVAAGRLSTDELREQVLSRYRR